jgi:hypothetical protein
MASAVPLVVKVVTSRPRGSANLGNVHNDTDVNCAFLMMTMH